MYSTVTEMQLDWKGPWEDQQYTTWLGLLEETTDQEEEKLQLNGKKPSRN